MHVSCVRVCVCVCKYGMCEGVCARFAFFIKKIRAVDYLHCTLHIAAFLHWRIICMPVYVCCFPGMYWFVHFFFYASVHLFIHLCVCVGVAGPYIWQKVAEKCLKYKFETAPSLRHVLLSVPEMSLKWAFLKIGIVANHPMGVTFSTKLTQTNHFWEPNDYFMLVPKC